MTESTHTDAADLLSIPKIHAELEELAKYIRNVREEIAALHPTDIGTDHIPRATDELDAVVGATEEATNKIMDICDEIGVVATTCPREAAEKLTSFTTRIFEACNFQDITGQRISKVVQTLKQIDIKVANLLKIYDGQKTGSENTKPASKETTLLNGPALPKDAVGQNEIDRLLSEA